MAVKAKPAANKASPGQMSLPWEQCQVLSNTEVKEVAEKFIQANTHPQNLR